MTREEQIADKLKEEMAALNRRIERLNQWKESGYEEPCHEHPWQYVEMHQEGDSDPTTWYIIRFKCPRCGMTMEQHAVVKQEILFDEWQEYRENKGDEEE
jgi:transcription initiation factor IIE alpha subunit